MLSTYRLWRWLLLSVLSSWLLCACGGGDGSDGTTTMVDPPSIQSQPSDVGVAVGATAAFTVTAIGDGSLSYQWQRNGVAIPGATSSTYALAGAAATDHGASFAVVVSNAGGSVTSHGATLTVTGAPDITAQPKSASVQVGQTATFSVTASGTGTLSYQWLRDGSAVAGANGKSLTVGPLAATDDGTRFTVRVSSSGGSVTSTAALLTVAPVAGGADDTGLAAGYDITLAVRGDGGVLQLASELPWTRAPSTAVTGSAARLLTGLTAAAVDLERLYALAVGRDGALYGWGVNQNGVLGGSEGNGNVDAPRILGGVTQMRQALATQSYALALRADGSVWHWPGKITTSLGGSAVSEPRSIAGLTDVRALASLGATADGYKLRPVAIKADGTVWELRWSVQTVIGAGGPEQTYTGSATQVAGLAGISRIACGLSHCLALTDAGKVLAWGGNDFGQLGNGTTGSAVTTPAEVTGVADVTAIAVAGASSLALAADGKVWTWGHHDTNGQGSAVDLPLATPLGLRTKAVQLAGGWQHAVVRLDDGSLWGWGTNQGMQLGVSGTQSRPTPVQAPAVALN